MTSDEQVLQSWHGVQDASGSPAHENLAVIRVDSCLFVVNKNYEWIRVWESPVGAPELPSGCDLVFARMAGAFSLVLIGAAEWEGGRIPSDAPQPWKDFACNQPRDL